jgi:hypothetical protein
MKVVARRRERRQWQPERSGDRQRPPLFSRSPNHALAPHAHQPDKAVYLQFGIGGIVQALSVLPNYCVALTHGGDVCAILNSL